MINLHFSPAAAPTTVIDWLAVAVSLAAVVAQLLILILGHKQLQKAEQWKFARTISLSAHQEFLVATSRVTYACNHDPDVDLTRLRREAFERYIELLSFCSPDVEKHAKELFSANQKFHPPSNANEKQINNAAYWKVRDDFIRCLRKELKL